MWYTKSYRRNLVDMHIEDWSDEFLSEFSPDEYYNNLVRGKIQSRSINTVKTLIENNVSVGVVSNGCLDRMNEYKFIFAPYLFNMTAETENKLIDYVRGGGNLYFSGAGSEKLLKELIGAEYTGSMTKETRTYMSPAKEYENIFSEFNANFPLPFECSLPIVELADNALAAAYISLPYTARSEEKFASIHSDPPGKPTDYPALVIIKYGKGNVIWSAAPIELDGRIHYKKLLMELMGLFVNSNNYTVCANAVKNIEIVAFKTDDGCLVSAIDLKCTEELIPVQSFDIQIKTDKPVKSVVKLPEKTPVEFNLSNGRITFSTGDLTMFAMYQIINAK